MKKQGIITGVIILVMVVIFMASLQHTTMAKKIQQDTRFRYDTSITGNVPNSGTAKVYTTEQSVPETAKSIINIKKPFSHSPLDNQEGIQLTYDDEYILIYKGEGGKTFVQVSSRKYVHRNGYYHMYRPFGRSIIDMFDRDYTQRGYDTTDTSRYGGGYKSPASPGASTNDGKIRPDSNDSSKIRPDSNNDSKIRPGGGSGSVSSGSSGSRSSGGGGMSFGK